MGPEHKQTDDDKLGQWLQRVRHRSGRAVSYWHLVETVVDGNPTTHCGRTWLPIEGTDLIFAPAVRPIGQCQQCIVHAQR